MQPDLRVRKESRVLLESLVSQGLRAPKGVLESQALRVQLVRKVSQEPRVPPGLKV